MAVRWLKENNIFDYTFDVRSYFGYNLTGLEDSDNNLDFESAKDWVHEKVSQGNIVKMICNETGVGIVFDPDEYFDGFEGEFPVSIDYFK